jgi:hypothetical protein
MLWLWLLLYYFAAHYNLIALKFMHNIASFLRHAKKHGRFILASLYLGPVYLSRLNLQQTVWYLGKAEPM